MARPTKEEAHRWYLRYFAVVSGADPLTLAEEAELRAWLLRVMAALPSAQAVARDRERRKKPSRQTHCPVDGVSHGEADKCDLCL